MNRQHPSPLRFGLRDCIGARLTLLDDAGVRRAVSTVAMQRRLARNEVVRSRLLIPMREVRATAGTFGAFAVACVGTIVLALALPNGVGMWLIVPFPLFIPIGLAAGAAYTAARFRRRSGEYTRLMKARALCPACIHGLEGIAVPDEGMIDCPGCGARWRFSPAASPITAVWCARCGYSLEGLPRDPAGVCACPECGEVSCLDTGASA